MTAKQLALFEGEEKPVPTKAVLTAKVGTNADLFPNILRLYAGTGDRIADVTYGKGVFWKNVDLALYDCFFTDLAEDAGVPAIGGVDMTNLPYDNKSIDMVVIDPPYRPRTARLRTDFNRDLDDRYRLGRDLKTQVQVLNLYRAGMVEAERVLVDGGILVVKCQDAVESGRQCWMHIDIFSIAASLGFFGEDLFVLVTTISVTDRRRQQHARKNHSFFWVFRKGSSK